MAYQTTRQKAVVQMKNKIIHYKSIKDVIDSASYKSRMKVIEKLETKLKELENELSKKS